MSKELFVTSFISGKADGSQKMRWWLRHSAYCSLYLQKWRSKKRENGVPEREHVHSLVQKSCAEWNAMVYRGAQHPLMTEHAELELALVNAAMGSDQDAGTREVLAISEFLLENVDKQLRLHRTANSEFPVLTWKDLLKEHVKLFTESIRWYISSDLRKYQDCEDRRTWNTLGLATFSTEWF